MATAQPPSPATPSPIPPATLHERESREMIPPESVLSHFISVNPARMYGEPCFKGTRVPVKILFEYLSGGDPLDVFLDGYPDVSRETAVAVIDLAQRGMLEGLRRL
jgi:uncharacterized protein (DUF433 family)